MPPVDYTRPFPGTSRIVAGPDGSRIQTVATGEGESTVVLAHGYGADTGEWTVLADRLEGVRLVAFDLRGHGKSTAGRDGIDTKAMTADYAAVLEAYDARDAVLVGHSTGGFLTVRLLLDHPELAAERVRGAVLVGAFAGDVNRDNPQNRIQIPLIRSGLLQAVLRVPMLARAFTRTLCGRPFDPAWATALVRTFLATDHRALVPLLRALVEENHYPRLGEIDMPCTIVVGERDKTAPPFHTAEMHAGIRGSRLVRVPDKGHLLNWEAPEVLVEEIRAHLSATGDDATRPREAGSE